MGFSDILLLYRARLGARPVLVQECFAILGIAVGVALLFASNVASTSLAHSVEQLNRRIVGDAQYQLVARGPEGFGEELLDRVRQTPGVRTAFPVLEQQANVIGPNGRRSIDLIGVDPRYVHVDGLLQRKLTAEQLAKQQAIALPEPVARTVGVSSINMVTLQIGAGSSEALVGTTLGTRDIGGLVNSPVAFAPVAYVQQLAGRGGRITRIFVRSMLGHEREVQSELSKLAARANVNFDPSSFDATLFKVASTPENQGETLFSTISALVGFMFALNAMLVTVLSRRTLVEDIHTQGATRRITIKILVCDALILGLLASVIGLVLGEVLSLAAFRATPGYLSSAFPIGDDRIVTWQSIVSPVVVGFAAALFGVLWPVGHLLMQSSQDQSGARVGSLGWNLTLLTAGVVCANITTVILIVSPQHAFIGSITLVVALVALLPVLFNLLVALFERVKRRLGGAATKLAVAELRNPRTRVRSLAVAATAATAVFGAVAIGGAQVNLEHGLEASAAGIDAGAGIWVTRGGESGVLATAPFKAVDLASLRRVRGVASVGLYRGSFLDWGERRLWVLAPPRDTREPISSGQILAGNLEIADTRVRGRGWAVLSKTLASEHHLHIGQSFTLPSPKPRTLRVAALSTNLGWPPGAIIMSSADYAQAWASGESSAYEIQTKPGVSPAAVRLDVRALGAHTGLAVETFGERRQRHYTLVRQGLSRLTQIRLLVLLAGALSVATALGSMIWQRRGLISFMKVDGYPRGVLWSWLIWECALMLGAGCLIGTLFGLYGQVLISHALASVTGLPILLNIEAAVALSSPVLVSATAIAIVALPSYLAVRVPASMVSPAY